MENTNAELQTEKQETVTETSDIDVKSLMARMEQLEQTNQRILDESKQYKNKYRSLRDEVESKEKQKLEESENWKELLDREKNEKSQLAEMVKTYKSKTLKQNINFEVARLAPNAFDINDVINNLPKDMLQIDEENLSVKGIDAAVNYVKEKKPFLFNTKQASAMVTDRPNADNGQVSFDKLSKQDQDRLFAEALKQNYYGS